jgi:hypothetical protein
MLSSECGAGLETGQTPFIVLTECSKAFPGESRLIQEKSSTEALLPYP